MAAGADTIYIGDDNMKKRKEIKNQFFSAMLAVIMLFGVIGFLAACGPEESATQYTVTFKYNDNVSDDKSIKVDEGTKVSRPVEDPVRNGYAFGGWYEDENLEIEYSFENTVNADITIYAKWRVKYTVTLVYNDGKTGNKAKTVIEGDKFKRPANPTYKDHTFDDWYTSDAFVTKYDFNSAVTGNINLYANWLADSVTYYDVTFDYNYPEATGTWSKPVADGDKITKPANPERVGYGFTNWYNEPECETLYDFDTAVTGKITIYAGWAEAFVMESEDVNFFGLSGPGISSSASETEMIRKGGSGLGASNDRYVSYTYKAGLKFTYNFTSDSEVMSTLVLRLASELGPAAGYGSNALRVTINGEVLEWSNTFTILTYFNDFTVTDQFPIQKGDNVLELTILQNNVISVAGYGSLQCFAPIFDNVKIYASTKLAWEPVPGNY